MNTNLIWLWTQTFRHMYYLSTISQWTKTHSNTSPLMINTNPICMPNHEHKHLLTMNTNTYWIKRNAILSMNKQTAGTKRKSYLQCENGTRRYTLLYVRYIPVNKFTRFQMQINGIVKGSFSQILRWELLYINRKLFSRPIIASHKMFKFIKGTLHHQGTLHK